MVGSYQTQYTIYVRGTATKRCNMRDTFMQHIRFVRADDRELGLAASQRFKVFSQYRTCWL